MKHHNNGISPPWHLLLLDFPQPGLLFLLRLILGHNRLRLAAFSAEVKWSIDGHVETILAGLGPEIDFKVGRVLAGEVEHWDCGLGAAAVVAHRGVDPAEGLDGGLWGAEAILTYSQTLSASIDLHLRNSLGECRRETHQL